MMLKSRKFVVWTTWALLVGAVAGLKVDIPSNLIDWFGYVSLIYIGGNVANKLVTSIAEKIVQAKGQGDE